MGELPRVTVVMPVRNEERYVERSLGAVLAQDYPPELLEVLVADGMSTDGTRRLVERLGRGRDVRVIDNPRGIVAPGLNAAIAEARGEVVVRVDGHCEIAPDYVRRAVEHLRRGGVAGVGGPVETVGETPLARAIAAAMSSRFGVGGSAFRVGVDAPVWADTIPFPAYPRRVLAAAGPFDEELVRNQDEEYNYRLRGAGEKLLLAPDLRSRYYSRADLRSLWRQYFQYGFWKVRVLEKHPRQMRPRQLGPPSLVAALAAGALAAAWSPAGLAVLAGIAAAYLLAAGAAALMVAVPWRYRPLMPVIFAAMHLGYGCGFWAGLGRRVLRLDRSRRSS
ncbi:MAG TPA: glycosyltransferase family 2 protein [Thermoanaerobaculia bacterium]|jgi:glycosyltransferase involved in cell wall biosynthesis